MLQHIKPYCAPALYKLTAYCIILYNNYHSTSRTWCRRSAEQDNEALVHAEPAAVAAAGPQSGPAADCGMVH